MLGSLFPRETDGIWLRLLSRPHANIEAFKSYIDIAGTRVLTSRRGKKRGTGPSMFMGVPITDEISWMTDSRVADFVG